ncbi:MAG: hypothetical protein JWP89_5819 [Schlesneria sp.]|nr:hypothetical protein [Schlesneria sp.]
MEMTSSRQRRLLGITMAILIMGSVVAVAARNRLAAPSVKTDIASSGSPEAAIAQLQAAQERGDVSAYLDCFSAAERESLEKRWQGVSQSQIASELRHKSVGVMGWATANVKLIDADHAELILESIREDSVDRQSVTLRREANRWKITSVSSTDRTIPKIPYGTPVDASQ